MALTVTGNITSSIPVAGLVTLTFTDTTEGVGTLVSRILTIYDDNGDMVDTINMGTNLTAQYQISQDVYLSFSETIIDNTGTYTGIVNDTSTAFYNFTFPPLVAAILNDCDTFGQIYNLTRAELYKDSAITFGTFGLGVNAQQNITQANFYLNTPYYA